MSELAALQRIKEAKNRKLTSLNLNGCGLYHIPKEVFELVWLEELILSNNISNQDKIANQYKSIERHHRRNFLEQIPEDIKYLKNLKVLEANNIGLYDCEHIKYLVEIKKLTLKSNHISNIRFLEKLKNIKELDISNNKINNAPPINQLDKLAILILKGNSILKVPSLPKSIKIIDLSFNKISNLSNLFECEQITNIDLSFNRIHHFPSVKNLHSLIELNISHNLIENLLGFGNSRSIIQLNISSNHISNIEFLKRAPNITYLNISRNNIEQINPLKHLHKLNELYLDNNYINDLSPLKNLVSLKIVSLENNKIKEITPIVKLLNATSDIRIYTSERKKIDKTGIFIFNNPITTPPYQIIEKGKNAILIYYKNLIKHGEREINEAKLIIVGEPGAGKTSLMKKLIFSDYIIPNNEDSTLGIKIEEGWQFPYLKDKNTTFSTNIWDFGGQQIQYMTHQFFLTPSAVYVLVSANDRKETTANFPYWFKIIHLLGEENGIHSPILVVQNDKNGQFINQFNETYYRERYPELNITTRPVDLKNDDDFKVLRNEIQKLLTSLPHVNEPRPAKWEPIRNDLRELAKTKNHISFAEYAAVCEKHEVNDEDSQKLLSYYLHRLGSLLHFADDTNLFDFIILNPQWAVDAVYSVLNDNSIAKDYGYFTYTKLESIWKDKYNAIERNRLLNLMKKDNFEICYQVECKENTYIAPQLLNEHRPKYDWNDKESLKFRFQYQFMPEGIITRLIVRLNDKLEKYTDENGNICDVVWRKGMVLNHDHCRAQIIEEENNRDGLKTIDIAVTGNSNKRKYLLHLIRTEVEKLHHKWFRNIAVEQMIPCICAKCTTSTKPYYFKFSTLEGAYENKIATWRCEASYEEIFISLLLEGIFQKDEITILQREAKLMTQVTHHHHAPATITGNIQTGNISTGSNSQVAVGHNITQNINSNNTMTITADQRKVINAVLDELLSSPQLTKDVRRAANKMTEIVEDDAENANEKTQTILAKVLGGLKQIEGFTESVDKVEAFVEKNYQKVAALVLPFFS